MPLPGSPLINNGSNTIAQEVYTDQRGPGHPRLIVPLIDIGAVETSVTDTTPPEVTAASFQHLNAPQSLRFSFSEGVSPGIHRDHLFLLNLATGVRIHRDNFALADYDTRTDTATFTFPGFEGGVLPDGNYRASFIPNGPTDACGNAVPSTWTFDFHVLAGDADRNRTVDFKDMVVLAQNYGATGRNFAQGNFNYDAGGKVDFADLVIIAQKYNTSLSPATPAPADVPILNVRPMKSAPTRLRRSPLR